MNAKHFGMLLVASLGALAMAGIGCGDSSGAGGAGGSATTGGTTTSSKTGVTAATGTGTGTGTSTGTGASCTATCETMHAAGYTVLKAAVINNCGCDPKADGTANPTAPCKTQCAGNPACAMPPGDPTGACGDCLTTESNKGQASGCSLGAATGSACQSNTDCAALVSCILLCP